MRVASVLSMVGGICACAMPIPASAASDQSIAVCVKSSDGRSEAASMAVPYSDLDLRLLDARKTLDKRIYAAANELCWKVRDLRLLDYHVTCRWQAVDEAREQVRRAVARAETAAPAI